jgi:hypothetical protein
MEWRYTPGVFAEERGSERKEGNCGKWRRKIVLKGEKVGEMRRSERRDGANHRIEVRLNLVRHG